MEKTSPTAKASDPVPRITPMAVVKPTTCIAEIQCQSAPETTLKRCKSDFCFSHLMSASLPLLPSCTLGMAVQNFCSLRQMLSGSLYKRLKGLAQAHASDQQCCW